MDSSSIVIKVKFGETLRRFNVIIHDKKLALDVVMLRAKIRGLFSFDPDADFTLTYVDEDGDTVTLADDDDLLDVVRQSLNPLRISVNLNTNLGGSNGTSPPPRSPQDQLPFQTLNSGVSEILKSVPEPLRDVLTKLPLDLASKATSSAPGLTELVEKLTSAYLNQISESTTGPKVQATSGSGASTVKDGKAVVDTEGRSSRSKNKEEKVRKVTEGVKFRDVQPPRAVDLNVPYFDYEAFQAPVNGVLEGINERSYAQVVSEKNKDAADGVEKKKGSDAEKKDVSSGSSSGAQWKPFGFTTPYLPASEFTKATNDSGSSSGWAQGILDATNQCPFVGMPLPSDSNVHGYHQHLHSRNHHWKKSYSHGNGIGSIFHRGVRCDGCGVHPITGLRFKSKVKEDYDLCSVCFAGMGNAADYIRLDRPSTVVRHHMPFKGFYDSSIHIPSPTLPHAMRAPGSKLTRSKLDSRFILDVNVLDGTIMAPFTAFTKIWRMRNNGTVIWPHGSQLQWIGGDSLSNSLCVDVEIPADGLPVDKELDIAVDFTAPELPGRYISYWRMASPSGQKFGQRVWVLIQVDASMKDLGETSINLNLPPVMRNPEVVANQDPVVDSIHPGNNFIKITDSENASADSQPKDQEMNFPINDTLIIDNGGVSSNTTTFSSPVGPAATSSVHLPAGPAVSSASYPTVGLDTALLDPIMYPTLDLSAVQPIMGGGTPLQASGSGTKEVKEDREQGLLRELEDMGFKHVDVNKEILRMNNYDLEKTVDDLCGVSEWDPMLEELQDMGFGDDEANRRLLKKNNGSIKGVVMDLINGENA